MAFYTWIHNVNYVIKRFLSETFFVTYSHELYKKGHRNNAVFFDPCGFIFVLFFIFETNDSGFCCILLSCYFTCVIINTVKIYVGVLLSET